MAIDTTYDNRDTCSVLIPTSCIPYTGYVSDSIKELLPCRPNANDVFKNILISLDKITKSLGDNTTLDSACLTFDPATDSQKLLNQELITEVCMLKTQVQALIDGQINPDLINLAVNLMCLQDSSCDPQTTYTLTEVITKLITAYCDLLIRVTNIESTLNI